MIKTHNLGFPRIGHNRELKKALEAYWKKDLDQAGLLAVGKQLRERHWKIQQQAGMDLIPVGDFAYYDHVLSTSALVGAVPERFAYISEGFSIDKYFGMARGTPLAPAMEMTKWFDTNYHYIVPEFNQDTQFQLTGSSLFEEIEEAKNLGINVKAVLLGPLSYLYLGKEKEPNFYRLQLLDRLLPVYRTILEKLKALGISWVQMDEPALVYGLDVQWVNALRKTYGYLTHESPNILLTTYFESVAEIAQTLVELPVHGLHLDLVRGPEQLESFLQIYPDDKILSLGLIDGRNIWKPKLTAILDVLEPVYNRLKERLWIAPSCSLLHSPVDLKSEHHLDQEIAGWLSFAVQKLEELNMLKRGLVGGRKAIAEVLQASAEAYRSRQQSKRIHKTSVRRRVSTLSETDTRRNSPFEIRQPLQQARLCLPLFPTTTIGSFPQTAEIRKIRADFKQNKLNSEQYREQIKREIAIAVAEQEALGLDVLVHGEAERNDMVEYFGEQLEGFIFTDNGWVQSYGSRCVKPPIIYGDVTRPHPMTIEWTEYAQSLTTKPMKGMLTGPVTILQWSFVRDDQPRSITALQIALAMRDEVVDLEKHNIGIIQIDEPALREGLPLKHEKWEDYLAWAGRAFRATASGVSDTTQIHTHMCYAEFNDILPAIAELDADVITIETSRSNMELLDGFGKFQYPNQIGPGVYDIHSPRIPNVEEMLALLDKAQHVIPKQQLWVNPDCGLKTRNWPEVKMALQRMVEAARQMRVKPDRSFTMQS